MKILKSKAIELIDEKITQLEYIRAKQINISDIEIYRREDDYLLAYYQTEVVLTELFSEEEMLKFRKHVTSPIWAAVNSRDSLIRYQAHMNHIQKCLVLLKAYRERIEVFWPANDEQGDTSSDMAISKTKALELIEKKIVQFKEVRDQANLDNVFDEAYSQAYYGTEHLLTNLFSEKEAQNFRRAVRSYFGLSDDPLRRIVEYKEHIGRCISQLEVYKERVENFWHTRPDTGRLPEASRNQRRGTEAVNYYARELYMGDRIHNEVGDISNNSGQVFVGKFKNVVANLNASNQTELAEALKTLQEAVLASSHMSNDEKQDQIDVINELGEKAAESKPNKAKLKRLSDGLIATLQAIPDVAKTVAAVAPILARIHL